MPVFGIAPCPTKIFTIGVLLTRTWRVVRWLLILPGVWAAVGGSAAILRDVPQDSRSVRPKDVLLGLVALAGLLFGWRKMEERHPSMV